MSHPSLTRLILLLAILVGVLSSAPAAPIQLPERPRLAADETELARLHAVWAGEAGRERAILARIVREAEAIIAQPIVYPPRGGQHNQWYQCEPCQLGLKTLSPTRHQCPRCKTVYSGEPYDDVLFKHDHGNNWARAATAGWAYAITGDERFAGFVREMLLGYAERYQNYPYHNNRRTTQGNSGGHMLEQTLSEASVMSSSIAPAYDLVMDSPQFSAADHQRIGAGFIRPMLENLVRNRAGRSNWQSYHNAAMITGGVLLRDPSWIERAIDDPENGFRRQMEISITSDGMWYENSWGYHFYTLGALVRTAETARRIGIDLWGDERFQRMFTLSARYALPGGRLPRVGDGGGGNARGRTADNEIAWHATRNESLRALLPAGPSLESILFGRDTREVAPAEPLRSEYFNGAGHAILRGPAPAELVSVLSYGPYGGGHGHFDKNSVIFCALGQELGYDPGSARSQAYRLPIHRRWYKATISHNTVLVDMASQAPAEGRLLAFGANDDFSAAVTLSDKGYPGVAHTRALVQTPEYLLIIDDLAADKPRRFDWAWHNIGTLARSEQATQEGKAPKEFAGLEFVQQIRQGRSDDALRVVFEGKQVQTHLTLDAQPATELLLGDGPGPSVQERIPLAIVTRQGRQGRFAAVLEPVATGGSPTVESVELAEWSGQLLARVHRTGGAIDQFRIGLDRTVSVDRPGRPPFDAPAL